MAGLGVLGRRGFVGGLAGLAAVRPAAAETGSPFATASAQLESLARAEVSSRELVDAAIGRIEARDGEVNAVVVRDFERARAAADAADAARKRGDSGKLLGLPMTVKEQFNVAGLPTCWGLERFRDWRAPEDALVVQRLRGAGAVILGKTNVPVNLTDWQSTNPVYGTTNNPWDRGRSPGGSSGGAAAALAAGFVPLELGSDIGGSLRAPAHFCGVYSHKPSLDLIQQRGAGYPGTRAAPVVGDMSVIGPLARSAADLALALEVLAGPDERWGGVGYRLALPAPRRARLAEYRVLLLDEHPLCPTAAGVRDALAGLADRLGRAGVTVLRRHPDMPALAVTTRVYVELLAAFFSADRTPEEQVRSQAVAAAMAPENQSLDAAWVRGTTMSHVAWIRTSGMRAGLRNRWNALFDEVDLVLCPPMPTPAFPHDHKEKWSQRRLDIDGKSVSYSDQVVWASIATLCGLPSTTVPVGVTAAGLPVGAQVVGGYLRDRETIAFAGLMEREFGGFRSPPGF